MSYEFKPFDRVLVRDSDSHKWQAKHFSHYYEPDKLSYKTTDGNGWRQCIPFESNEHLLDTTKMPKEKDKPFEWGERLIRKDVVFPDNNECIFICYLNESECKILYKNGLSCFEIVNTKELRRKKDE